jgi:hypothetical protein
VMAQVCRRVMQVMAQVYRRVMQVMAQVCRRVCLETEGGQSMIENR